MSKRRSYYEEVRRDYEWLCEHHDSEPEDLTGGLVSDEKLFSLLRDPRRNHAAGIYHDLIIHAYQRGFEGCDTDEHNPEVRRIFERWCDPFLYIDTGGDQ